MNQDSDLSEYERVRLENIRRNNEFLAQLGLVPLQPKVVKREALQQPAPRKAAPKIKREDIDIITSDKRRRSGRLSGQFVKEDPADASVEDAESTEHEEVEDFYERVPQESDQLDDFEFQAFVELRRWRLFRSRELAIAPYGLFNNRTFCDMIRRRRNDSTWATAGAIAHTAVKEEPGADVKVEASPKGARSSPRKISAMKEVPAAKSETLIAAKKEEEPGTLEVVYDPSLTEALTGCFGIAAGKTREGGYAWEALAVLNKSKVSALLEQSRLHRPKLLVSRQE